MEQVLDQVSAFLSSALGSSATIAIVLEFVWRLVPSEKPKSVLHLISFVAKKLSEILAKIAELSDKVLPQKLK
jgi:hypothetical protein